MTVFSAIVHVPDEWSRKARCPVCQCGFLLVKRSQSQPDRMHCSHCGASFLIEKNGEHIFFTDVPVNFPDDLAKTWLTREEVIRASASVKQQKPEHAVDEPLNNPVPAANPLRAEAVRRARQLAEWGNSPESVRAALKESMQLSEYAIDEVVTDAFNVHRTKQRNKLKYMTLITAVVTLLMVACFVLAAALV